MEDSNMIEIETITLEDNKDYMVAKEKDNYLYLVNINDPKDFCIRKEIIEDGKKVIVGLQDFDEFTKALDLFKE